MGNGARANLDFRYFVIFALKREALLRQAFTDNQQTFDEAVARLFHGNTEPSVLNRGGAAAKPIDSAPARDQIEQGDFFCYFDRVVPRQYDHRRAELHALGTAGD